MDDKFLKKYERKARMRKRGGPPPWLERLREKAQFLYDKIEDLVTGETRLRKKTGNLTGVSATLAEYLELKPALVRLGFIVGSVLFWPTILIYAALAFIIPSISDSDADHAALEGDWGWEDDEDEPSYVDLQLCEHCDTALKPNAKFCHSCGKIVGAESSKN